LRMRTRAAGAILDQGISIRAIEVTPLLGEAKK